LVEKDISVPVNLQNSETRIISRFNTNKYFGEVRRTKVTNPSEYVEYEDIIELSPRSYHT
jgi:hypothetical protein